MTKHDPARPHCRYCAAMLREQFGELDVVQEHLIPKLAWVRQDGQWRAENTGEQRVVQHHATKKGPLRGYGYMAQGVFCSAKCGYFWATERIREEERQADERRDADEGADGRRGDEAARACAR